MTYKWRDRIVTGRARATPRWWLIGVSLAMALALLWLAFDDQAPFSGSPPGAPWAGQRITRLLDKLGLD